MIIDLVFPCSGLPIPTDHSYLLFSALSRLVPAFHHDGGGLRFAPITGKKGEKGRMMLSVHSALRVRCTSEALTQAIGLAGRTIEIADSKVGLKHPTVEPLSAAASLFARVVIFKNCDEPGRFIDTARQKLKELEIEAEPGIAVHDRGPRAGEPQRRIVRIHGKAVVGYSLFVEGLTAPESMLLQEKGLGGRTRIGCGFFLPARIGG